MLACNCLNVIIEPESNDFQKVTNDLLELTEFEKRDNFFKQEIQQIPKLNKVTKKVSGLVATRLVGSRWMVHHCLNCNIHTHAVHRDRGAAFVLVSCRLLDNEAISQIKGSEYYSTVFDISIPESNSAETDSLYKMVPSDSEPVISSLRQRVNEFINREAVAVEENIRKFTEDQFRALDEYRKKALQEHHILRRKILENELSTTSDNESSTNIDKNLLQSNLTTGSPLEIVPETIASTNSSLVSRKENVNKETPTKKSSSNSSLPNRQRNHSFSFDSDVFFPLEDMDDEPSLEQSDVEDSDPEDFSKDENGEPIPRQKQPVQLAKSLPVNIPVFMSAFRHHANEDNDDEVPDDSMDIAASIKALAKSIQGGTVFGELPRPRFSSQI